MRIGILGGTFSPIHCGHISIAKIAMSRLNLDTVLFLPNRIPPHKDKCETELSDKINMIKEAIKSYPEFKLETFEVNRDEVSYLYITLEYLKEKYKNDTLYFICGADNIKEISSWKYPARIFNAANVVFVKRPQYIFDEVILNNLSKLYKNKVSILSYIGVDVSSTEIRERTEKFLPIKNLVPDCVKDYIFNNHIYPVNAKMKLSSLLYEKRYIHSLNVAKEAYNLAKRYNEDEDTAYYAGLLHDCAKKIPDEEQLELIRKYNKYEIMEDELSFSKVLHALCGPIIAEQQFNVTNKKILDAIRFHTLGNINMTLFDKIIFVADLISADRNYKGVEIIRKIAYNNIDKAIIASIDNTLSYLDGEKIQPDVIKLRNYLKENI